MPDETMQLLKAYIEATGYEIGEQYVHPVTREPCNPPIFGAPQGFIPSKEYEVTKKKPKPRAQAKESAYGEYFEKFWGEYPKNHGGNKQKAYRQWGLRIQEGGISNVVSTTAQMFDGMRKYKLFVDATSQTVMHPATFLGRDKHYEKDFTISKSAIRQNREKQDWEFIPENDHLVFEWAKKHSFKVNGSDKIFETRRKLKIQIKDRIENEG